MAERKTVSTAPDGTALQEINAALHEQIGQLEIAKSDLEQTVDRLETDNKKLREHNEEGRKLLIEANALLRKQVAGEAPHEHDQMPIAVSPAVHYRAAGLMSSRDHVQDGTAVLFGCPCRQPGGYRIEVYPGTWSLDDLHASPPGATGTVTTTGAATVALTGDGPVVTFENDNTPDRIKRSILQVALDYGTLTGEQYAAQLAKLDTE